MYLNILYFKQPHPCVIYLHGNSSSRIEGVNIVEYLIPYDIAVVLVDFAGCGLSEGEFYVIILG